MQQYKVGVLGATGTVGQRFITLLKNHPWFKVTELAASANSAGKIYKEAAKNRWVLAQKIPENVENIVLKDVQKDYKKIISNVDFVFCAVNLPKKETVALEELYAKNECPVISNNSANRLTPDVPMILPEINPHHTDVIPFQQKRLQTKRGFIAVKPNCSLQSYIPAIYPILKFGINKIFVCTCQAISGAGKTFKTFPEIEDNLIPYIPGEENKTEVEPLKIFGKIDQGKIVSTNSPEISAICLRVPITDGHTAAVFVEFNESVTESKIIDSWQNFQNPIQKMNLPSSPDHFLNYLEDESRPQVKMDRNNENGMGIFLGRLHKIRNDYIKFVCISHNTIRGAAGGAILLAELLCYKGYI